MMGLYRSYKAADPQTYSCQVIEHYHKERTLEVMHRKMYIDKTLMTEFVLIIIFEAEAGPAVVLIRRRGGRT